MNDDPSPSAPSATPQSNESPPYGDNASPEIQATLRLTGVIIGCLFSVFLLGLILSNPSVRIAGVWELFFGGYLYGSVLAIVTFAAIWSALGGGFFGHRLGFAALWNFGILATVLIALSLLNGPAPFEFLVMFALVLCAAWLLPQGPLWALRFFTGIRFDIPGHASDANANQFGLRHLFIFTSIIAILLGAGRAAISLLKVDAPNLNGLLSASYVLTSAATLSVALLIAALLQRYAFYGVLLMLGLTAIVGYWELSLLSLMTDMRFGPDRGFFICQKLCLAAWLLIFAYVLRRHDFRFIMARR